VVQLLLKRKGFDADFKANEFGQTPLTLAAAHGHLAVVRLLVEYEGVDVNSKDNYG
jgi:ankyrin repeat protein